MVDSILNASKKLATVAGLRWAEVQPYYRALQESGGRYSSPWLPKSSGRQVWAAHPHYVLRLLIALACAPTPSDSHEAVEWVFDTLPGGRDRQMTERHAANRVPIIEQVLSAYLTNEEDAADLVQVEFQPDRQRVVVVTKSQGEQLFALPADESIAAQAQSVGIVRRSVILGSVFVALQREIAWREDGNPLLVFASSETGGELS